MFAIAVTVGLRPGEASGLTWERVDLGRGTVTVASEVRLEGGRPVLVERLKTLRSYRTVLLPRRPLRLLRSHYARQEEEKAAATRWDSHELVFSTRAGTPLHPSNVRRELDRIARRAGIPRLTPNELRHTAASIASARGLRLEEVADMLGHKSTRMLEETYRHPIQPSVDTGAVAFGDLLGD